MKVYKFKDHPYAQAQIEEFEIPCDGLAKILVSYTTIVATIDTEGWLHINGLYSATTRKHIGWFMRELGFTYQLAKALYNDNKEMNIYTGEVIDCDA